ncbi:hypothetical protein GF339_02650 [candidate division KSB3 bacterium]|uniref:Beta/gamma crystallin 'Greek key' domain-containing protein n=1 Tax=candidate division KSB3 bacterium TaxID=2044937 RepID=A0A9D5JSI6_9BACT|nr:hypothetical protein [candidate division KSB3 bacterium]MBD3323454.1 hypothetical protein [candidate division KSB3 bacterium]
MVNQKTAKFVVIGVFLGLVFMAGSAGAQNGVILYDSENFQGESVLITQNEPDLKPRRGTDPVGSIRVPGGCEAVLYEQENFQGDAETFRADDPSLKDNTAIEYDYIRSIKVRCGGGRSIGGGSGQVILYEYENFQGNSETFAQDDPDLKDNKMGTNPVWSLRISPGCEAVLFEQENFQGDSEVFRSDDPNLGDNVIENDFVRSLQIRCSGGQSRGGGWGDSQSGGGWPSGSSGVTLYEHENYGGRNETLRGDDPDLSDNAIGNDAVSSLRIAPGCEAALYEHADYQGRWESFKSDVPRLRGTRIGNDMTSSIRVYCR